MREFYTRDDLSFNTPNESMAKYLFEVVDSNREYLKEFLPWLDHSKNVEDSLNFISKSIKDNSSGSALTYMVSLKDRIIGVVCLHNPINFYKKIPCYFTC